MTENSSTATTLIEVFRTENGNFVDEHHDLILVADFEFDATGRIEFLDGSAIEWDMNGSWVDSSSTTEV